MDILAYLASNPDLKKEIEIKMLNSKLAEKQTVIEDLKSQLSNEKPKETIFEFCSDERGIIYSDFRLAYAIYRLIERKGSISTEMIRFHFNRIKDDKDTYYLNSDIVKELNKIKAYIKRIPGTYRYTIK